MGTNDKSQYLVGVIFSKQILNFYNISLARLIELSAVKTDWYCGVNIRRDFHKNDGSSCSEK